MSAVPRLRSMRTRSPVLSSARPPLAAASGEALRIEGEPDVPDWRPSPMHGSEVRLCLKSRVANGLLRGIMPAVSSTKAPLLRTMTSRQWG
jgi:hypothetical protein